jgi:hypothetical protein
VASLPKLFLQCCQFAALPGAAQDFIVGGCDTPNLFTCRQAWFRYLLYRNVSTDFFALLKDFSKFMPMNAINEIELKLP